MVALREFSTLALLVRARFNSMSGCVGNRGLGRG
jgi:hypothetical protein